MNDGCFKKNLLIHLELNVLTHSKQGTARKFGGANQQEKGKIKRIFFVDTRFW